MKRVLYVTHYFRRGGVEAFLMNNLRRFDHGKFTMDFMALLDQDSPYRKEIESFGGRYICPSANFFSVWQFPQSFWRVFRVIRQGHYDIVHSQINLINGPILLAAFLAGVPVRLSHAHNTGLYISHGSAIRRFIVNDFCKFLVKRCSSALLACGKEAGAELYDLPVDSKNYTVIHNGIDLERYLSKNDHGRRELRAALGISQNCRVYGNVTRFDYQKNLSFAVDVFAEVLKKDPSARFILGGVDGDKKMEVLNRIAEKRLGGSIVVLGERSDMDVIYKALDCYVFPSVFEGLPFALLEAQASGLPVVTSSNVPSEVDMGLGLISFLPLKEPEKWAAICVSSERLDDKKRIHDAFVDAGYDISDSVRQLARLYTEYCGDE